MAGGDGSFMNLLMKARENGVNIASLISVVLPYGTGNDFAQVTGWGKSPTGKIYKNIKKLVTEICLKAKQRYFNVWSILISFRQGGTTLEISSKTRDYVP